MFFCFCFLMLVLLVKYIFLTPSMVDISIINYTLHAMHAYKNDTQVYYFHGDLLWAAFMYCIYTCLSDLWATKLYSLQTLLLSYLALAGIWTRDLPGTMLPTELSGLGFRLTKYTNLLWSVNSQNFIKKKILFEIQMQRLLGKYIAELNIFQMYAIVL